jgi:hypothetical protein
VVHAVAGARPRGYIAIAVGFASIGCSIRADDAQAVQSEATPRAWIVKWNLAFSGVGSYGVLWATTERDPTRRPLIVSYS